MELRSAIPNIFLKRLIRLREDEEDPVAQRLTHTNRIEGLMHRLTRMGGEANHKQIWRERIVEGVRTSGLEDACEASSSRS